VQSVWHLMAVSYVLTCAGADPGVETRGHIGPYGELKLAVLYLR